MFIHVESHELSDRRASRIYFASLDIVRDEDSRGNDELFTKSNCVSAV